MTMYTRHWEEILFTQLPLGHIGHLKNDCDGWNYDQIYEILENISLTQPLVGHIGRPKNFCNRWKYDQRYEILGRHLIDPATCGKHRASQE